MANETKPIGIDATGYDLLTNAVKALLNQFPGLYEGEKIKFEELGESDGIAFSADNGALVMSERITITGKVIQNCQYLFYVVYRSASNRESYKIDVQSFLDTLGKWICREWVSINDENIRLAGYPDLTNGRKVKRVTRTNSYGLQPREDGVQDWLLPCTIEYTNEYYR